MPKLDPEPLMSFEPGYPWKNKHRNLSFTALRLYNAWNRTANGQEPTRQRWRAGLNALRRIVTDAETAGRRVRAYGGAWSISQAAECHDFLINTKPLNYVSIGLTKGQVLAAWVERAPRLVFAQCGVHVMELHSALEGASLALPTSGASNGQTFAGAVSTGTHGAAWTVGSMQDYVRGIHLVVEGGRHLYIEPASMPVVSKAYIDTLGAELRRGDALFRAALVSFGSFGIIHGLLFEAAPLYELSKYRFLADHAEALAFTDLDFTKFARARPGLPPAVPYHFEITLNPYRSGAGQVGAFVTAMYHLTGATPTGEVPTSGGYEPGDDVISLLGELTDVVPASIPELTTKLVEAQLKPASGERATPGKTFGSSSIRGNVLSSELAVSLADSRRALEGIVDVAKEFPFPGLIAARFVRSSAATLAFTRFAPISCTVELPGAGSARTTEFHQRVFQRLDQDGIRFTLHWGQWGDYSAARVRSMYGASVEMWLSERRKLLSAAGRRMFSNPFLEGCGLSE
ncbi:MAG TPA: FAD-binding protein [Polyangiaceae bacterium]|jgi:FAD/FMN-containing dehydrogenase